MCGARRRKLTWSDLRAAYTIRIGDCDGTRPPAPPYFKFLGLQLTLSALLERGYLLEPTVESIGCYQSAGAVRHTDAPDLSDGSTHPGQLGS
jgi:hypothetical protein